MTNTVKELVERFESIYAANGCAGFIYENISELNAKKDNDYPILFLKYPTISKAKHLCHIYQCTYFILGVYDFNNPSETRKIQDIQGELQRIGMNVFNSISGGSYILPEKESEPKIEFGSFGNDRLVGSQFTVTIQQYISC